MGHNSALVGQQLSRLLLVMDTLHLRRDRVKCSLAVASAWLIVCTKHSDHVSKVSDETAQGIYFRHSFHLLISIQGDETT